jgi:carbamoyl-phosphate synthase large subunit
MKDKCNILFASSGRRIALLNKFKETLINENIKGNIITADNKKTAPTAFVSDKHYVVPKVNDNNYLNELLDICRNEKVDILIPLIDTELVLLSGNTWRFEEVGVKVLVSGKKLNEIAENKNKTYEFFISNQIKTPRVYTQKEIESEEIQYPLLIKPWNGSSSRNVVKVLCKNELLFFKDYIPNAIVQEYVSGQEFTIDVFVDFNGNIKTIVPRQRIETRAGEVSKGITIKDVDIIQAAEKVVQCLPNPVGCLTLQCFKLKNGEITFIEINPRFGGGIPLSIEAGANFPLWTIQICQGMTFKEKDYSWQDKLTMLRYDDALFLGSLAT